MQGIISACKLGKVYTNRSIPFLKSRKKKVLEDIDLDVARGEKFALIGPNGSGKTTLIKIFCGLVLPTSGRLYIKGTDVVKNPGRAILSTGFCLDSERSFYYRLSGRKNLMFFAALNRLNSSEAKHRVDELITELDMGHFADRLFMQYSSGQKQRLALARALLTQPEIIFLDEPTKSLDVNAVESFWRMVDSISSRRTITVFTASHNITEVEKFCTYVAFMKQGKILDKGRQDQLLIRYGCSTLLEVCKKVFPGRADE